MSSIGSAVGGGIDIAGALGAFDPPTPEAPDYSSMLALNNQAADNTLSQDLNIDPVLASSQQRILYNNMFGAAPGALGKGTKGNVGTLQMMQQASPALTAMATTQQAAELGADQKDMATLAPEQYSTIESYNPAATGLLSSLDNQAQQQLNTNGGLTPAQQRQYQQQIRGAQAVRGFGQGPGDAASEANYLFNNQQQIRQQNQALAGSTLGAEQSYYGSPYSTLQQPTPQVPGLNFTQPTSTFQQNDQDEISQLFNNYYTAKLNQQTGAWQTQQKYLGALTGGGSSGGSGGSGGGSGGSSVASMAAMFL